MQPQQGSKERGLLSKRSPGEKRLDGKTFYLDNVKRRPTDMILELISLLGGRVESFLHKDVNFVVTGSKEGMKEEKSVVTKGEAMETSEGTQHPIKQEESGLSQSKQQPGTSRPVACGSRGKALLEKAIRNNERLQGSSVLANARSWGVKILYVDDVLLFLNQLTRDSFSAKHKKPERTITKQQGSPSVKALALRSPYLKIEDLSRKYRPLHMQSLTFPTLCYLGRFSPFESPPPPRFERWTEQGENKTREKKAESTPQDKSQTPLSCNPLPWRPRKKDLTYCECCHQPFNSLEEHLQSDQHRAFVLDPSNYCVMDQLVVEMLPGFDPNPSQQSEETLNRTPTPLPLHDVAELVPLTDAETEHAVQVLQEQGSSLNSHTFSPTCGPLSHCPASPSHEVQVTIPNPASQNADIQSFDPDIQPRASSLATPMLNVEPQVQDSVNQQPDTQHVSPCHSPPCSLPDPYSLPPVLSPQVPSPSNLMELHSSYSEPPVLSPQQYIAEETSEGQICDVNTAESVSELISAITVPLSTSRHTSVAVTNTEATKGLNQEVVVGFTGLLCSNKSAALSPCRSHSVPRQSVVAPNPRKRFRSASPEHRSSKRRRAATCGYSDSWAGQRHKTAKPQSDNMAKADNCLLLDKDSDQIIEYCPHPKVSSTPGKCAVDILHSKQTCATFCFPTAHNFIQTPSQNDSVVYQPPCPRSLEGVIFDPLPDFTSSTSYSVFSSRNSQPLLSHSTSVCIEPALIPDLAALSPSSSDWDCDFLSQLGPTSAVPQTSAEQNGELDKELLHRPCPWMHDTSYESHLHTVLQPSPPATSLCGEETDPSSFSRTVVHIVEVQH